MCARMQVLHMHGPLWLGAPLPMELLNSGFRVMQFLREITPFGYNAALSEIVVNNPGLRRQLVAPRPLPEGALIITHGETHRRHQEWLLRQVQHQFSPLQYSGRPLHRMLC